MQDRLSLIPDTLELTIGAKLLHDQYADSELQPSARLLWTPDDRHTLWGAVTRAVKTPGRHHTGSTSSWGVFTMGPSLISQEMYGDHHLDAEEVTAYELATVARPLIGSSWT
jgi:iron complex outermembrane recepter protein